MFEPVNDGSAPATTRPDALGSDGPRNGPSIYQDVRGGEQIQM